MVYEYYTNLDECLMLQYINCSDDNLNLCIICQLDEFEINKEPWMKCNFKVGHTTHSRCARKWFNVKISLNCPYCGDIELIEKNMYCSDCKMFGHINFFSCPRYLKFLEENNNNK